MGLARYSREFARSGYTLLDNAFINEYLPHCPEKALKVYIYALFGLNSGSESFNSLEKMSSVLELSQEEIIKAFEQLEEMGLVEVVSSSPLDVKYLPVSEGKPRKIRPGKYSEFTKQVQTLLPDRMITLNEFNEYFNLIETYHIEPEALIMVIKYCTLLKGTNINYRYIVTVAKNWISRGIVTLAAAEQELCSYNRQAEEIKSVHKAMGYRGGADFNDTALYTKWREQYGFSVDTILYAARLLRQKKGNMEKLNLLLDEYYKNKKFSIKEIEDYNAEKQRYREAAFSVLKELGQYLPNVEPAIENYILPWMDKGYDEKTLRQIANYCFKVGIKSLEGMDKLIIRLHKLGLISLESINEYIEEQYHTEKTISEMLERAGINRQVNTYDRSNFRLWTVTWGLGEQLVLYAASCCRDYFNPLKNLHALLSYYKSNGIFSVEKAREVDVEAVLGGMKRKEQAMHSREYTREELNAMFTSVEDYEV
ncbi:MAG: DnaD domain protein [Clostridiales bacterium]|mgnify:CR=1 FL=1|nr:DnaD domain protein [Clostridiales bacterium]